MNTALSHRERVCLSIRSEEGNTTLCTPSLSLHFAYQIANQLSVTRKHRGGKMFSEHRQHWSHALYPRLQHFSAWHTRAAAQLPRWRHPLVGYIFGLLLVASGLSIGLVETQVQFPFSFPGVRLLFAVVIVAFLWGALPALFTVLLSLIVLDYLYVPPFGVIGGSGWSGILQLITFASAGIVIAILTHQREAARIRAVVAEQEALLRANELAATFEAMSDSVVVYNAQRQVRSTNAATRRLFGLASLPSKDQEQAKQKLLLQAVHNDAQGHTLPEKQQPLSRVFKGTLLTGENTADVLVRTADGAVVPEDDTVRPIASIGFTPEQERAWREQLAASPLLESYITSEAMLAELKADNSIVLEGMTLPLHTHVLPYYVETVLVAPICVGNRLVGLLCVDDGSREHTYCLHEMTLLQTIARLTALILARAQLLREHAEALANERALRNTHRRMEEFLGVICHELKTPLTVMKGSLQLAERKVKRLGATEALLPDEMRRFAPVQALMERARSQVVIQDRLVSDLLDASRVQAQTLRLLLAPCNLVNIVQEAVEDQRQIDPSRTLYAQFPNQKEVLVHADADRLIQVVMNYLTNALKYSPPDQPVEVCLTVQGTEACVSVRDKGPGLALEEQERVWERFYRVSN